jgi:hypothetical protein
VSSFLVLRLVALVVYGVGVLCAALNDEAVHARRICKLQGSG